MKIYTKTGDKGETSLYGGERRSKADARIGAYGAVDEVQAALGYAESLLEGAANARYREDIQAIQTDLFVICCELARTETKPERHDPVLADERVAWLESEIDQMDAELPQLRSFIMQGGAPAGAWLHVVRTFCRRAERTVVELQGHEEVRELTLRYLNRLSDYLFVLARRVNANLGKEEVSLTL